MSDYPLMCQTSPVQKEWKPKNSDLTDQGLVNTFSTGYLYKLGTRPFWLPRQEDWQEILLKEGFASNHPINMFYNIKDWIARNNEYSQNARTTDELLCIIVHKEVYGLVWDWEEKKWKR